MVGAVALARSAAVVGAIGRIGRREAAQSAGRQQVLLHQGQDLRRALALHQGKGQREGEELVGADRGIGAAGSEQIEEAAAVGIPKLCAEGVVDLVGAVVGVLAQFRRKMFHDFERVVPQRVDLDRFADPGRHYPVADLGVHPGQLHSLFASG